MQRIRKVILGNDLCLKIRVYFHQKFALIKGRGLRSTAAPPSPTPPTPLPGACHEAIYEYIIIARAVNRVNAI